MHDQQHDLIETIPASPELDALLDERDSILIGAPAELATARQLRAEGLRPGGQEIAAQILWRKGRRVAYLYRRDLALPKRQASAAQRAAVDKALLARRTCPGCRQLRNYYIPRRTGVCLGCPGSPIDTPIQLGA
jgi:hypothetical protein